MSQNKLEILTLESEPIVNFSQSANSLFHFMKTKEYLETALSKKALTPRYCLEDIDYLYIMSGKTEIPKIGVLEKCFCDIPLHKIYLPCDIKPYNHTKELKPNEKSHAGFYGPFAIAFSKDWCIKKNLQPIHYLNPESSYTKNFSNLLNAALTEENFPDEFSSDILQRLSLIKPLQGKIGRNANDAYSIFTKNFHDEQEWRYFPEQEILNTYNESNEYKFEYIVAKQDMLKYLPLSSTELEKHKYKDLWLTFDYNDIKHIIVSNRQDRLDIITFIMNLANENFNTPEAEKLLLISKILVLDEIKKDW